MADEPKVDQSVMISLDNLLSDDELSGLPGAEGPKAPKGVNLAALGQVGLNQTGEHRAPIHAPVVQRLEINGPKRSGVVMYLLLTLTGVGLVGGGIFLGNRFVLPSATEQAPQALTATQAPAPTTAPATALTTAPITAPITAPTTAPTPAPTPAPAPAPGSSAAAGEGAGGQEARGASAPKSASPKQPAKPKAAAKEPEPAPEPAAPPPEPAPAPRAEPKRSEAASLLSALKSPKGPSPAPGAAAAPAAGGLKVRLEREDILGTVRKNQATVNQCKAMVKTPGTRVELRLVIDPSGAVSAVTLLAPEEYKGSPLEGCVKERVSRFAFPQFGGAPMSIKLPFML